MLNLSDIGLTPARAVRADLPPTAHELSTGPLAEGSVAARALWALWSGIQVTVVSSPPGGGKSTLVVDVINRLANDAGMKVSVAAPTRVAAKELARKAAEVSREEVHLAGSAFQKMEVAGVTTGRPPAGGSRITVRTLASSGMSNNDCDVLVIDEAYQVTVAQVLSAAERAEQIFLVGDPGQIGPVWPMATTPWEGMAIGPHMRSPEGFLRRAGTEHMTLPSTYRLGPITTEAIAPLYDFAFDSQRPDVALRGRAEVETILLDPSERLSDPAAITAVVDRVDELVGRTAYWSGGGHAPLSQEDVAVIAARNEQTTAIAAALRTRGLPEVTVGTADRLQGGQWAAVVALDPIYGAPTISDHSSSLGRLCVMATRHIAHLSWVSPYNFDDVLEGSGLVPGDVEKHLSVRQSLVAAS